MGYLSGYHVALTASRKTEEMQTLLFKQGATSDVRSMQGTVIAEPDTIAEQIKQGLDTEVDCFIFTTGIGVNALLEQAEQIEKLEVFIKQIQSAFVIVRGYKAVAALKKVGIVGDIVSADGTTVGLLPQLQAVEFTGKRVILQQYGLPSPQLETFLADQGAKVMNWLPYVHYAPESEEIDSFINELLDEKKFDAVCFTTALQVKSLFVRAQATGKEKQLLEQFKENTLAVAVGKVTAESLIEEGVSRIITPKKERMGAMIIELARYAKQASY